MPDGSRHPEARLTRYAADSLDWPAVRALLVPLCPSELGRRALLDLVPRELGEARDALDRACETQALLEEEEEPPLAGAPDPLPALRRALQYGRALSGPELYELARHLRLVEELARWLAARSDQAPRCAALWAGMPNLAPLRIEIEAAVDCHGKRGRVRDDASPALERLRREIERLEEDVDRRMKELAHRQALRPTLAEGHAGQVHRRGGRRVLAVRQRHVGQLPGIVHDRSQTGETLFVEPRQVVESQNALSALEADAEHEVNRILTELTRQAVARRDDVEVSATRCGELELAVVSARYARAVGGRPARLPEASGGLVLRAWRHPLLLAELDRGALAEVVAIDLRLGAEFDLLVVTGPNTGGKTLALKGAGLAALMTRMGLALPVAEGTVVPLYEGVVADIGDEQEIQQNLSTFSSHLKRVREGLARASERTLVLLDELGGGTDPTEGAALGEAILAHLLARGVPTLASTHLGKLKEFAYRNERVENAHVEFDLETLAPRFRVVIGAPGESRALAIARRLGLAPELVDEAEDRLEERSGETAQLMNAVRDVKVDAERLRSRAEDRLVELEGRLETLRRERDELQARDQVLEAEAQRGVEERIAGARPWLDRARALLPQFRQAQRAELEGLLDGLEEALGGASLSDRRRSFLDGLKKGSLVWVPRFKKRCQVTRIRRERRTLDVRIGRRDLTVGFDDVTFYESL